jgi:hypothetical protein
MWDNLFDATPDYEKKDVIPGRYYNVSTLVEEDHYRISIIYDSKVAMKSMELFGVLDDGCFCLMRTALESIENSSAIANRFMGYIGIVISLAGAIIALLLAGRITEPIRELTEISARMKKHWHTYIHWRKGHGHLDFFSMFVPVVQVLQGSK